MMLTGSIRGTGPTLTAPSESVVAVSDPTAPLRLEVAHATST